MSDGRQATRLVLDQLRVRCARARDESLKGFRLRVAELNGYSIHEVLPDMDPLAPIGNAAFTHGMRDVAGTLLPRRNVEAAIPKVCPACMADRHLIPAVWELSLWTACPVHECRMTCECQDCSRTLSWSRTRLDRCCDATPFRQFETTPAPEATVQLLRRLAAVLGFPAPAATDINIVALTKGLSAMEVCDLIWLLGRLEVSRTTHGKLSLPAAAELVETAASILSGWPNAFHKALERVYAVRSKSTISMEISLGPLFRRLYKQRGATGLGFVHDEFRRFHGRRNGWIHSRDYAANGAALSGPVSLGDISDRLGVVWRSALRLVETGAVAGTQRAFGRRKSVIVDAAEFTDAARKAGLTAECRRRAEELGAIGTRQVEGLLGVSAGMVKQFQAAGLLGEPIPLAFGILVSGDEVRRLLLRLEDLAASSRRLKGDQSATSGDRRKITRLGLEDHTPAECLRAVIDGGIVPVAVIDSETGLNRFSFELAEVRQSLDAANVRRPAGGKSPR